MNNSSLWYTSPASEWTDALPLGNGRLGAMVYGGVARDEFQLNEDTLWSAGPYRPTNPEAASQLGAVREMVFAGKFAAADVLIDKHMMGRPYLQASYQPAGRLLFDHAHLERGRSYRRTLDLTTALATTSYEVNGVSFVREAFVSAADGVLVIRVCGGAPASVSFSMEFASEQPGAGGGDNGGLIYQGRNRPENNIPGALSWYLESRVAADEGAVTFRDGRIEVDHANSVVVLLDIATSFRRFDDVSGDPVGLVSARLQSASALSYETLRDRHVAAHRAMFDRFSIDLGQPAADIPTDQRIAAFQETNEPALAALYVDYGRYLAICSSRPGTQPANLQGIWNKEVRPPWSSKYTTNINLQMNYWLSDAANLAECVEPLISLVEDLSITGAETARVNYGGSGWVLHHNTDLWRATAPIDGSEWGMWPTGGAWLCAQLWDHARFAGFPIPLVERLYPLMKGAAEFFLDTLVTLPGTDQLVTNPSVSPENRHPGGTTICAGPAMDRQLLRDLFSAVADAAALLGRDHDFALKVREARSKLPPDRIGKAGQLQEWLEDWDMDVPEIHHRHVSHLYGVYPSLQISPALTPELAKAARLSLDIRGDDATGWGIGWRINLWARLGDGNHAHEVLRRLLHPERSYKNLFDAHPPFQIDGNFGGSAGILEMLVQSDGRNVHLLPAVPEHWTSGRVDGIRARGGVTLSFAWKDKEISDLTVTCSVAFKGSICRGERTLASDLPVGVTSIDLPASPSRSHRNGPKAAN